MLIYKTQNVIPTLFTEFNMYAKFPFYSIAQIYAIRLNVPVSILLGRDNLYWVVDQRLADSYSEEGCSQIKTAN
jgi:hypothetical protein